MSRDEVPGLARLRVLSAVLMLELLWLVLIAASIVFLAAHLGLGAEDFTGDATVRGVLLAAVPPVAIVLGLALIGARQALDRIESSPVPLSGALRLALWLTAVANGAVVVSILISLYHARMTWLVVGLLLAIGLAVVAGACVHAARESRQ